MSLREARRFPPPWTIEDIGAAFVVKDSAGQQLAYVYFEDESGRRSAVKLLTNDCAKDCGEYRQAAAAVAVISFPLRRVNKRSGPKLP